MQKLEHSYTTGSCRIIIVTYVGLSSSLLIPYLAEFNAVQNLTLAAPHGWLAGLQSGIINFGLNPELSHVRRSGLMLIEFPPPTMIIIFRTRIKT